eukprot:TRINITY_DN83261_c0_g1_i1.p1 TRINITY_DN83261_c0_g1~~TRINITY_DN83261_c0_g1_i1.p1  ORF type:complete len:265 (+),score=47.79 TRINITY_DN83261_c0_g1_i1:87-881(+)
MAEEEALPGDLLGLQQLRSLLHHWKSALWEGLQCGDKCVLTLVVGDKNKAPIDGACSAIVTACNEHLRICKMMHTEDDCLPNYLVPVIPLTSEEFEGSDVDTFLRKHGIGFDVLVLLDSIEEVMGLSAQSHTDPNFAARIDLVHVTGAPPSTSQVTPIAGSNGLQLTWAAFTLLETVSIFVPSRCGPALFMGPIEFSDSKETAIRESLKLAYEATLHLTNQLDEKLEGQLWNRTDRDLIIAIEAILKGSPTVRRAPPVLKPIVV